MKSKKKIGKRQRFRFEMAFLSKWHFYRNSIFMTENMVTFRKDSEENCGLKA